MCFWYLISGFRLKTKNYPRIVCVLKSTITYLLFFLYSFFTRILLDLWRYSLQIVGLFTTSCSHGIGLHLSCVSLSCYFYSIDEINGLESHWNDILH